MKQLGVLDSAFINLEHPNTPQHIGGLGIYDPSTAPGGFVRFKQVIANFEKRLNKYPMFRSRLVRVPGDVDRPYWIKDANFDVEFHIRHIALPEPGDWRQLCIQAARLHARPLDMTRPLWEAYIIEGLDNIPGVPKGGFALYTKMHHSLVDGAGGASFLSAIHDLEPNPASSGAEDGVIEVDSMPNPAVLAASAAVNQLRNSVNMARGAAGMVAGLGRLALDLRREKIAPPPIKAPRTRFNTPVGHHRVFEAAEFPLEQIKRCKDVGDAKVNDVVLAIVAGAMRKYLDNCGELPPESLVASIPLNMRTRRGVNEDNNQVGSVFLELHTNIKDPLSRLRAIHKSSIEAQEFGERSPLVDTLKVAGMFAPVLTKPVVNMYVNNGLSSKMPANISTVISNVAGPPFPLYTAGSRMVRYYGLGLLTPGLGLFHLAFSADGVLTLSILGDRDQLPDPERYKQYMQESFDELLAAVDNYQKRQANKAAARPAAARKRKAVAAKRAKVKSASAHAKVTPPPKAPVSKVRSA